MAFPFFPLLAQFSPGTEGSGLLLLGLGFCVVVLLFVFWLWMLLDCIQIPAGSSDYPSRMTWIMVLLFAGWIGAAFYFFAVRERRLARRRARHARAQRRRSGRQAASPVPRR